MAASTCAGYMPPLARRSRNLGGAKIAARMHDRQGQAAQVCALLHRVL